MSDGLKRYVLCLRVKRLEEMGEGTELGTYGLEVGEYRF